jgi:hypothetical protein
MSRVCFWGDVFPAQMPRPEQIRAAVGGRPLVVNLESPLTNRGPVGTKSVHLISPVEHAIAMKDAGIVAVHIANNHMLDAGLAGLEDTLKALSEVGIHPIGRLDKDGKSSPALMEVDSIRTTIIGYGEYCTPPLAGIDVEAMRARVSELRPECDRLVVSLHWGIEYVDRPSPAQRRIARALIYAGADLIVGHHPHVASGVERIGKGWVAYSLGNACLWVDEGKPFPGTRVGIHLDYDVGNGAVSLKRILLGDQPGALFVGQESSGAELQMAVDATWNDYLRVAGPIYLRSQSHGWKTRLRNNGVSQAPSIARWLASKTFLQMAWGCILNLSRERGHRE